MLKKTICFLCLGLVKTRHRKAPVMQSVAKHLAHTVRLLTLTV
jgi:hypothetical protein